jgi:stage III sporulation protein SpoIIIAA
MIRHIKIVLTITVGGQAIVVDEIGTKAEAQAIHTIGHRGITVDLTLNVIGTAHGDTLTDVVMNPDQSCLLGNKSIVTMGDETARYMIKLGRRCRFLEPGIMKAECTVTLGNSALSEWDRGIT